MASVVYVTLSGKIKCRRTKINSRIRLTHEAWDHFDELHKKHHYPGRGRGQGIASCIVALLEANPTPAHWTDTRPAHLSRPDAYRISHRMLPLWFDSDGRAVKDPRFGKQHTFPDGPLAKLTALIEPIADHFGIRSKRSYSPTATLAAFLDAVGWGYLTPKHPPEDCITPRKRVYAKKADLGRYDF